jgi:Mlc titration factor MtfA (ptsG expression regulator)
MKIQLIAGEENDERFKMYLQEWLAIGEIEYNKLRSGIPGYLRSYAGENSHEFFAVCVEHFFEAPDKLRAHLPDIYNHMCVLLNQNPLNMQDDYYLTDEYMHTVNTNPSLRRMPRIVRKVKP